MFVFFGTFAKLLKATVGFVISLFVRMGQLGSHWRFFYLVFEYSSKICR